MDVPEESVSIDGEFEDAVISTSSVKTHKTRREKRNSRRQHWEVTRQNLTLESTGVSAAMLRGLQQKDTSLAKVCQSANSDVDCTTDKSYYWHDGLLYHQWKPHGQDADRVVNQHVLSEQCRGKILSVAHSIPLVAHLSKDITRQRIMQHFSWPTL